MHERVLENWLDNANERAFQIPFSHSLAAEGYRVVHVSRHCAMELGKDILAISPEGIPCAYQLKGVKGRQLNLGEWRADLEKQIHSLVFQGILHPSIPAVPRHQAYIVINGMLSEEVSAAITAFNQMLPEAYPKLKTIVKGELLARFKSMGSDFWPEEVSAGFKTILELVLADGHGPLEKEKFSYLLETVLGDSDVASSTTSKRHAAKISSAAILASYATSSFERRGNHGAEFEALTMLFAHTLAYVKRYDVGSDEGTRVLEVISQMMFNCLARLCDELMQTGSINTADPLLDRALFTERITWITGLMALYGLYSRMSDDVSVEHRAFVKEFVFNNIREMKFTREGVAPSFLLAFLYWRLSDATLAPDRMLRSLVRFISASNGSRSKNALASPYYDAKSVFEHHLEITQIKEEFSGSSYVLGAFWDLLVRANLKQAAKALWPLISQIDFRSFQPDPQWKAVHWMCATGTNLRQQHPLTRHWRELESGAYVASDNHQEIFKNNLLEFMAFVLVYPHRFGADACRVICDALGYGWKVKSGAEGDSRGPET